jgi:3-oxoacyl-[acyl-carrier protein] reductase
MDIYANMGYYTPIDAFMQWTFKRQAGERSGMSRNIRLDLSGRRALVTGGARGIGEAICRALGDSGAAVAVNYCRSAERAERLVAEMNSLGQKAVAIHADVSDEKQCVDMMRKAAELLGGPIDILVNNAGGPVRLETIEHMPADLWRDVLTLNLTAAMICSREAMPGMKAADWGRIVNIASIAARSGGGPAHGHYAAAKAGMRSLTKSLAKELGEFGVTSNSVSPGVVMTEIHEQFNTPDSLEQLRQQTLLKRLGTPDEIAGVVLFLCSAAAAYITGEDIAVNGGLRLD